MKVGDLVRVCRKASSNAMVKTWANTRVPLGCFGVVVVAPGATGTPGRDFMKVDFGDYGAFWMLPREVELLS